MNKNTQNLETRQVVINAMIEDARKNVITYDLESKFVQELKRKIDSGEVTFPESGPLPSIDTLNSCHEYHLQRLLFFKELREANKAKKLIKKVKMTTPERIEVNRVSKEESPK